MIHLTDIEFTVLLWAFLACPALMVWGSIPKKGKSS